MTEESITLRNFAADLESCGQGGGATLRAIADRIDAQAEEIQRLRTELSKPWCSACNAKPMPLACQFHPPQVVQTASGEQGSS
jgi:hypothetical protein